MPPTRSPYLIVPSAVIGLALVLCGCPAVTTGGGPLFEARDYSSDPGWNGWQGDLQERRDCTGGTALHIAAWRGDLAVAQDLISAGLDPAAVNARFETTLHVAAARGHIDIVDLLLAGRGRAHLLERQDNQGRTALHHAAIQGHAPVAKRLLGLRSEPDAAGYLPLHYAAVYDRLDVLSLLADASDKGVNDLQLVTSAGHNALHLAASRGATHTLGFLLDHGADLNAVTPGGKTALHLAAASPWPTSSAIAVLLTRGATPDASDVSGQTPLHAAADAGNVDAVARLVAASHPDGPSPNERATPLALAIEGGHTAAAEALLAAGADWSRGLNAAVRFGSPEVVLRLSRAAEKYLDGRGNKSGEGTNPFEPESGAARHRVSSAFEESLTRGPAALVAVFLDRGLDPNLATSSGSTPLSLALRHRQYDVAALLLSRGVHPDAVAADGSTSLHDVVLRGDTTAIALLALHGASVKTPDRSGRTTIDLLLAPASERDDLPVRADSLAALLRYLPVSPSEFRVVPGLAPATQAMATHAHPDLVVLLAPNDDLDWAVVSGDRLRVQGFLKRDPMAATRRSADGQTPLHRAVAQGHLDIVADLLGVPVSPDLQTSARARPPLFAGWSAAHFAMWRVDIPMITLLQSKGADFALLNTRGQSPAGLIDLSNPPDPRTLKELFAVLPDLEFGGQGNLRADADSDGVPDFIDRCPHESESFNAFDDEDGCPDRRPTKLIQGSEGGAAEPRWSRALRPDTGPGSELILFVDREVAQDAFDPFAAPTYLPPIYRCIQLGAWPEVERLASSWVVEASTPVSAALGRHNLARAWLGLGRFDEAHQAFVQSADQIAPLVAQAQRVSIDSSKHHDEHEQAAWVLGELAARIHESSAFAYELEGRYRDALASLDQAFPLVVEPVPSTDPTRATRLSWHTSQRARVLTLLGRYADAIASQQQTLALRKQALGPQATLTRMALANLGVIHGLVGDEATARRVVHEHLTLTEDLAELDQWEGESLSELATARHNAARFALAEGNAARSVALLEAALTPHSTWRPSGWLDVRLTRSLGDALLVVGRPKEAVAAYRRALTVALDTLGERHPDVALLLVDVADLTRVSDPEGARDSLARAWLLASAADSREVRWRVELALARWSASSSRKTAAIHFAKRAVAILEELRLEVAAIGPDVSMRFGTTEDETHGDRSDRSGEPSRPNRMSGAVARKGVSSDLERFYLEKRVDAYRDLAELLIDEGRFIEAQEALDRLRFDEARTVVLRHAPPTAAVTRTPAETRSDLRLTTRSAEVATLGAELVAIDQRARAKPPSASDRARREDLTQRLARARVDFDKEVDLIDEELERENQSAATPEQRTEVADRIHEAGIARTLMTSQMQEALDQLDQLGQLVPSSPASPPSPGLAPKRNASPGLRPVLIHYLLGQDHLRIFITTPDIQIAHRVPFDPRTLFGLVFAFRQLLTDPTSDPAPVARELYDLLIAPIAAELKAADARTLMIAPDGILRYIPFAALHDGERWLVERFRLATMTPVAQPSLLTKPTPAWTVAAFGVARAIPGHAALDAVGTELETLVRRDANDPSGIMDGLVRLDDAFSRTALVEQLAASSFNVIHIASHFAFQPMDPKASYLLLGDGEHLDLDAIRLLRFRRVDLLTLSACNTAVGDATSEERREGRRRGREIESLAQIAITAGARSVLATLWPVADQHTAELMLDFYRRRTADSSLTKADALRLAMLSFIRGAPPSAADRHPPGFGPTPGSPSPPTSTTPSPASPLHNHPFYWAPFTLIGNWL